MEEFTRKKLREMKKNNKGFSLVELIVVIAIMVVLIAVLGSTILGYVEKSKYSKDIQALDSIKTACSNYVAEPGSKYNDKQVYKLSELMVTSGDAATDPSNIIAPVLKEVFNGTAFNASSKAFDKITTADVLVYIDEGAVSICVPVNSSESDNYKAYTAGSYAWTAAQQKKTTTP